MFRAGIDNATFDVFCNIGPEYPNAILFRLLLTSIAFNNGVGRLVVNLLRVVSIGRTLGSLHNYFRLIAIFNFLN